MGYTRYYLLTDIYMQKRQLSDIVLMQKNWAETIKWQETPISICLRLTNTGLEPETSRNTTSTPNHWELSGGWMEAR